MVRLTHYSAAIFGILVMVCGVPSARAQSDPFQIGTSSVFPSRPGLVTVRGQSPGFVVPGGYSAERGAVGNRPVMAANYYAPGQQGIPMQGGQSMQAWPRISPFENQFTEHRNEGGLWFRETRNGRRRYFAGMSAMFFDHHKPQSGLFGNAIFADNAAADGRSVIPINGINTAGDSVFNRNFKTEGIRVNWGYWDIDDTGLEIVGWWASQNTMDFNAFTNFDLALLPTFEPRGYVVPANNGTPDGAILFFNGSHALRYRQVAANVQVTRMLRTVWEWNDAIVVRPTYGARFTFLREGMFFSGFDYFPPDNPPYQTTLNNDIRTYLAGPEVGIHATIGGDALKVTFGTKFILYVNHERQRLDGTNFIDIASVPLNTIPNISFRDQVNSTRLSPAFEQTVHFEAALFQYIPFNNRMDFFKNAKLKGGFTYLDISGITRPGNNVNYNSFPLSPNFRKNRSKFSTFAWDVGFYFEY